MVVQDEVSWWGLPFVNCQSGHAHTDALNLEVRNGVCRFGSSIWP